MIGSVVQICVLVYVITMVQSARILAVFPTPSISHQMVFRTVTTELVKRGHEVTVITTDVAFSKNERPENLTEIDVHDISYEKMKKLKSMFSIADNQNGHSDEMEISLFMAIIIETQLNSLDVQNLMLNKNNQFDLILIEALSRPALAFSHIFKAPVILVSSFGASVSIYDSIGAPTHPLLYPSIYDKRIYNLTLWEKAKNIVNNFMVRIVRYLIEIYENMMLRKYFGSDMPSVSELYNNVVMLFLNVHPMWADNRPVPQNVIYMGGIHQKESKELPEDIKSYLDSSQNGVIYISFGTNAVSSIIPQKYVEVIAATLSQLPYDILWKWDEDELPIKTSNIKLSKWLLQADLLKHPKIKLFITQGGLQSTDEAITAGVPLLAIPMLADQWYNAEKYVYHGIGKQLLIKDLTVEVFKNNIEAVISDDSFRQNLVKLRNLMLDQPQPPLDRAMWWIEHVLRHGDSRHLKAPSANISWMQYLQLDVIFVVICIVATTLAVSVLILSCIFRLFKKSDKKVKIS